MVNVKLLFNHIDLLGPHILMLPFLTSSSSVHILFFSSGTCNYTIGAIEVNVLFTGIICE